MVLLEQARILVQRNGKYVLRPLTIDLAGSSAAQLRQHWARTAAERVQAPAEADLFSYNLVAVSDADYARIRALHVDFFRKVRAIVARSRPSESAALLAWHLIKWTPDGGERA